MRVHDVTGPSRASLSRTADLYDLGKDTRYLLHDFSALLVGYKSSRRPRPLPSLCDTDNDLPICFAHHKQRTITFLFSLSLSLLFRPFPLSPPIILHLSSPFVFFLSPTPFLPHILLFPLPIFSSCGMTRNRGREATDGYIASSERSGKKGRKRSYGKRAGQAPNEAAGRRPRDLDPGVDDQSADERLVEPTSSRAPDLDRAVMASDRPNSRKVLQTVALQVDRPTLGVEDVDLSISDSSASYRYPPRYDGVADQDVFDDWRSGVEAWAAINEHSPRVVMHCFPLLVTGNALWCFKQYVSPTLHSRKWEPKKVFKVLQKRCFPPDYKLQVHSQLVSATQGNLRVIAFARKIKQLAEHVPYPVDEEFLATIFYTGLDRHIKARLILDGIEPDSADLETIVHCASKHDDILRRARALGVNIDF